MSRAKKIALGEEAHTLPFPTRLRELLVDQKITQEELANTIGAKRQSVGQWKDGATSPDINILKAICENYDISADYLLGLTDVKSKNVVVVSIHEETGLSEKAIERLLGLDSHSLKALNTLLENQRALGILSVLDSALCSEV